MCCCCCCCSIFLGGQQVIDKKAAEKFWDWFAKVLQKLRYQRHLCTLWKLGWIFLFVFFLFWIESFEAPMPPFRLIYGFINKDLMEQILLQQQVGSFALRFSETNAGSLSIGYRVLFCFNFFVFFWNFHSHWEFWMLNDG